LDFTPIIYVVRMAPTGGQESPVSDLIVLLSFRKYFVVSRGNSFAVCPTEESQ